MPVLMIHTESEQRYVADYCRSRIRRIDLKAGYNVTTVLGTLTSPGLVDGVGTNVRLNGPADIYITQWDNTMYIADKDNDVIRKANMLTWETSLLSNTAGTAVDGVGTNASFRLPFALHEVDGYLYIGCFRTIRRMYIGAEHSLSPSAYPTPSPFTTHPATSHPQTSAPSLSPQTEGPTTNSPGSLSPLTSSPFTLHPVTSHPLTTTPTSCPITASPLTISPSSTHPASSSPFTEIPTSRSPRTDVPITVSPATSHPQTQTPGTSSPTQFPATPQPSQIPLSDSPTTLHPLTASPETGKPTTSSPLTSHPTTLSPTTLHPLTSSPETGKPTTSSPLTSHPTTFYPSTSHPVTSHPGTSCPVTTPAFDPTVTPTLSPTAAPFQGITVLPTRFPTSAPSPSLNLALFGPAELGPCGSIRITSLIETSGTNPVITWYFNELPLVFNSSGVSQEGIFLKYEEVVSLASSHGFGLVEGTVLHFAGQVADSSIFLTSPLVHVYIKHKSTMQPSLLLRGLSGGSVSPASPLYLSAFLTHPECVKFSSSVVASLSKQIHVKWDVRLHGYSMGLEFGNTLDVVLPPGSLIPNHDHQIKVTVSGISTLYPGVHAVSASSNVSVAISLPVVVLSTGKAAQVPSVKSVLIDASDSYDPAKLNNTQRSFEWSCFNEMSDSCLDALLLHSDGSKATLFPNSLSPASTWTLKVNLTLTTMLKDGSTFTRTSEAWTQLTAQPTAPVVSIKHMSSTSGILACGDRLRLTSKVLSDSDRASYVWSEESGALNGLTVEKRLTDENSPSLVLDSLALSPGAWYTFVVRVDEGGGAVGSASIVIQALNPPTINSITYTPTSGIVRTTTFHVTAHAYAPTNAQRPLRYMFMTKRVEQGRHKTSILGPAVFVNRLSGTVNRVGWMTFGVEVRDVYGSRRVLWSNNQTEVSSSGYYDASAEHVCRELNITKSYLEATVMSLGVSTLPNETTCQPDALFFYLDLLVSLKAYSKLLQASNRVLAFLATNNVSRSFNLTSDQLGCFSCSGFISYATFATEIYSKVVRLTRNGTTQSLTSLAAQILSKITSSPLTQSGIVTTKLATAKLISKIISLNPDLSPDSTQGRQTSTFLAESLSDIALQHSKDAPSLARDLLVGVSEGMVSGEAATIISTHAFNASAQVVESTNRNGLTLNTTGSEVRIAVPKLDIDARLLVLSWEEGLPVYAQNQTSQDERLISTVYDVTLSSTDDVNAVVPVPIPSGETIRVEIPISSPDSNLDLQANSLTCAWWDDRIGHWSSEGCKLDIQGSSSRRASCVCTHLTEFAVMHNAKASKNYAPSAVLKWSYTAGASVSITLFFCSGIQFLRLLVVRKHKEWIGVIHAIIALHSISRAASDVMFSGQVREFSLIGAPDVVVVLVACLPYSFGFWVSSMVAFQWISTAYNSRLTIDPFRKYKIWYYSANIGAILVVWMLIVLAWIMEIEWVAIAGPVFMSAISCTLLASYIIAGRRIYNQLIKDFKTMDAGKGSRRLRKQVDAARRIGIIVIINAAIFLALTGIWIVSICVAIHSDDVASDIVVPAFLLLDILVVASLLCMYRIMVNSSIKQSYTKRPTEARRRVMIRRSFPTNTTISSLRARASRRSFRARPVNHFSLSRNSNQSTNRFNPRSPFRSSNQSGKRSIKFAPRLSIEDKQAILPNYRSTNSAVESGVQHELNTLDPSNEASRRNFLNNTTISITSDLSSARHLGAECKGFEAQAIRSGHYQTALSSLPIFVQGQQCSPSMPSVTLLSGQYKSQIPTSPTISSVRTNLCETPTTLQSSF
ncbi:hypothetical protein AAMO2058_000845200 [Amorphochlora amoebiformis]